MAAAGFPEDEDVIGIATKGGDIVPDPFERSHNVKHSDNAGGRVLLGQIAQIEIAHGSQAMITGNYDNIVIAGEGAAVMHSDFCRNRRSRR